MRCQGHKMLYLYCTVTSSQIKRTTCGVYWENHCLPAMCAVMVVYGITAIYQGPVVWYKLFHIIHCNASHMHIYRLLNCMLKLNHLANKYRIAVTLASIIVGEMALHWYWRSLNLAIWKLTVIGVHALSSIGEFFVWWSIPKSPNRQIKNLAKASRYTVNYSWLYSASPSSMYM